MRKHKPILTFAVGALVGALLSGGAVYAVKYTPQPSGDWIRDTNLYDPGTDQINVLGDIQPGASTLMLEIGLRLNALSLAGKKKNWDLAAHEIHEIEETMDKLGITRPALKPSLDAFIATSIPPVEAAITAQDKGQFKAALKTFADACTACHVNFGKSSFVVKIGKSALPLK